MSTNYSEQMLDSMVTIFKAGLNQASFDKTEICTIINKVDNEENVYWVTNGSVKYQAKAEVGKDYGEGMSVYVTIPQGNYDLEKIIIGSYKSEDRGAKLYTNPFDKVVKAHSFSYWTTTEEESEIAQVNLDSNGDSEIQEPLPFYKNGFGTPKYLALRFNAQTNVDTSNPTGIFTIKIEFFDNDGNNLITQNATTNEEASLYSELLTYSSLNMTGNPYKLSDSLWHEHVFSFPIKYKDKEIFSDLTLVKRVKYTLNYNGDFEKSGVVIHNLEFYAGYNADVLNTEKVVLDTTYQKETYTKADSPTLRINWRHLKDNTIKNRQLSFNDDNNNYQIYLFKYVEGYTKDTSVNGKDIEDSGVYWKTIEGPFNASDKKAYIFINNEYYKDYKYVTLDTKARNQQFKVGIKNTATGEYIESKGLTFYNSAFKEETKLSDLEIDNLILSLDEGDDGIYNEYGIDNRLLNFNNRNHNITVDFADNTEWDVDKIEKVEWRIPYSATMLTIPQVLKDNNYVSAPGWNNSINAGISTNIPYYFYSSQTSGNEKKQKIQFAIKDQFDYSRTDNIIRCYITLKDGSRYQGKLKVEFGSQGTSGTTYNFNIYPNRPGGLLYTGDDTLTFEAKLENNKGEPVNLSGTVNWYYVCGRYSQQVDSGHITTSTNATTGMKIHRCAIKTEAIEALVGNNINMLRSYLILKAEYTMTNTNGANVTLSAYHPIPRTTDHNYYINGPVRIVYDHTGKNPNYIEEPYTLYEKDGVSNYNNYLAIRYKSWKNDPNNKNVPSLKSSVQGEIARMLNPLSELTTNTIPCNISFYESQEALEAGETPKYACPLLILSNSYSSDVANNWDGTELVMDEKTATIMSNLLGAGIKDTNNKYSGVLMGAVEFTDGSKEPTTGLYGFKEGDLRYKLDENGDFYVGTAADNKIDFINGNLSIAVKNFKLESANFSYNTSDNDNKGGGTIAGWTIDDKSIRSGSLGYSGSMWLCRTGTTTSAKIGGSETINGWCIGISDNFGVTKNGYIYARAGQIAAWTLGDYHLYGFTENGYGSGMMMKAGGSAPAFYIGYTKKVRDTSIESAYNYPIGKTGWKDAGGNILGEVTQSEQYGPKDGSWFSYGSVKGQISNDGYFAFGDAKNGEYIVYNGSNLIIKGGGEFSGKITASQGDIAGWAINSNIISKTVKNGDDNYKAYMQSSNALSAAAFGVQKNTTNLFYVSYGGHLYAGSAEIEGEITATSGNIGGWSINTYNDGIGNKRYLGQISSSATYDFFLSYDGIRKSTNLTGNPTINNIMLNIGGKFVVNSNGKLYAKEADIEGSITATSGTLDSVTINKSCTINGTLSANNIQGGKIKGSNNIKIGGWTITDNEIVGTEVEASEMGSSTGHIYTSTGSLTPEGIRIIVYDTITSTGKKTILSDKVFPWYKLPN